MKTMKTLNTTAAKELIEKYEFVVENWEDLKVDYNTNDLYVILALETGLGNKSTCRLCKVVTIDMKVNCNQCIWSLNPNGRLANYCLNENYCKFECATGTEPLKERILMLKTLIERAENERD